MPFYSIKILPFCQQDSIYFFISIIYNRKTMADDLLNQLNNAQKEAVKTIEGSVLILAGPGSGKTRALTHRIAYLIQEKRVNPANILAVTFTNKAADEMRERVEKLLTQNKSMIRLPWLGTFHRICVRILKREIEMTDLGYSKNFTIYDKNDSLTAVKKAMEQLQLSIKQISPHAVLAFISGAKNELLNPSEYRRVAYGYFQQKVADIYPAYQKILVNANAMDFDDLIMNTVLLFQKHGEILERYQNLFQYILIDEYQDTNQSQYLFSQLLAKKHRNICVVGDDSQAIYGFRGANFQNILNFHKDYPKAKIIKLEQNYRSTKNIISAAQKVIEQNKLRSEKKIWTDNEPGNLIFVYNAPNEWDEAEFITGEIKALQKFNTRDKNAVLFRTNAQSRIFEETFLKANLPYKLVGAVSFYNRAEIKDLIAYLRVVKNPKDEAAYLRIVNIPPRGIGKKTIEKYRDHKKDEKIEKFEELLNELRQNLELPAKDLLEKIIFKTGYKEFILDGTVEGESRWENIEELLNVGAQYPTLDDFLDHISLVTDADNLQTDAKTLLMTLHNAKGLEFENVFIVGMEEGLLPHANSLMEMNELEEERRLFYVGMTRAKKRLYLTWAQSRSRYGSPGYNVISRFLEEIPQELIEQ